MVGAEEKPHLFVHFLGGAITCQTQVLKLSLDVNGLEITLAMFDIFSLGKDFLSYNWCLFRHNSLFLELLSDKRC